MGSTSIRVQQIPRTRIPLRNEYVLFYSSDSVSSLPNASIARLYNIHWMGNVVVMKCSRRDPLKIVQMSWGEQHLVDIVVAM